MLTAFNKRVAAVRRWLQAGNIFGVGDFSLAIDFRQTGSHNQHRPQWPP